MKSLETGTFLLIQCVLLCGAFYLPLAPLAKFLSFTVVGGIAAVTLHAFFSPLHTDETLSGTQFYLYTRYQIGRFRAIVIYPLVGFCGVSVLSFHFSLYIVLPLALGIAAMLFGFGNRKKPSHAARTAGMMKRGTKCINLKNAQISADESLKKARKLSPSPLQPISFGGVEHSPQDAQQGYLFLGNPGSGKSTLIEMLLSKELKYIYEYDHRAIIYDDKGDMPQFLEALGFKLNLDYFIMNPFDFRCTRWDIAKDCTDDSLASQFASILIPDKEKSHPYFDQATKVLIEAVFKALIRSKGTNWTWRDLVNALSGDKEDLLTVVYSVPGHKERLQYLFQDTRLEASVLSTVMNHMNNYRMIASSWEYAKEAISVSKFIKSRAILVLGSDPTANVEIQLINRVLFQHLVDKLRNQPDVGFNAKNRTWLVIDETKQAGALDSLAAAISAGRSRGLCTMLGVQDKPGLSLVYGTERASEITDLSRSIAVFNCGAETAKWASELFGTYEALEFTTNSSISNEAFSVSEHEQIVTRPVVTPNEITGLPDPKYSDGVYGFFHSPVVHAWHTCVKWKDIEAVRVKRLPGFPTPEEARITQERMEYKPWTPEERITFNLKPLSQEKEAFLSTEKEIKLREPAQDEILNDLLNFNEGTTKESFKFRNTNTH